MDRSFSSKAVGLLALVASVKAQSSCTQTQETAPALTWQQCTAHGSCTDVKGAVTVDANWRWTHQKTGGSTNCYTGNKWSSSLCPDSATCTSNCCIDGASYQSTYGVTTSGSEVTLDFVTHASSGANIGSRLYLLANDTAYQGFKLLGNEFTFDADVSALPCGLNGALYFVSMDLDGGAGAHKTAGPKYGTGYCDAQCPRDLKFIDGQANNVGWVPSTNDVNSGVGPKGACCAEMDIWEANSISNALTPHPCKQNSYHSCSGDACGGTYSKTRYAGDCDPDGCDFNPFRQGATSFFGPGKTVDTKSKVTVVTQFVEESGSLSAIKRFYVQNGKVIANAESTISGNSGYNSITEQFCKTQKTAFGDSDIFNARGGFSQLSKALADPMVLVLSLWDDHYANMLWLDSNSPANGTGPGIARGTCGTDTGVPSEVEASSGSSKVKYSNIKFGPIGSTFDSSAVSDNAKSSASSSSAAAVGAGASTAAAAASSEAATKAVSSADAVATSAAATKAVSSADAAATSAAAAHASSAAAAQPSAAEPSSPAAAASSKSAAAAASGKTSAAHTAGSHHTSAADAAATSAAATKAVSSADAHASSAAAAASGKTSAAHTAGSHHTSAADAAATSAADALSGSAKPTGKKTCHKRGRKANKKTHKAF